jgi:hypothetical protein
MSAATGAASTSIFSTARFFAGDFLAFADVDLAPALGLVTLPAASASALLFFATAKIPPSAIALAKGGQFSTLLGQNAK